MGKLPAATDFNSFVHWVKKGRGVYPERGRRIPNSGYCLVYNADQNKVYIRWVNNWWKAPQERVYIGDPVGELRADNIFTFTNYKPDEHLHNVLMKLFRSFNISRVDKGLYEVHVRGKSLIANGVKVDVVNNIILNPLSVPTYRVDTEKRKEWIANVRSLRRHLIVKDKMGIPTGLDTAYIVEELLRCVQTGVDTPVLRDIIAREHRYYYNHSKSYSDMVSNIINRHSKELRIQLGVLIEETEE